MSHVGKDNHMAKARTFAEDRSLRWHSDCAGMIGAVMQNGFSSGQLVIHVYGAQGLCRIVDLMPVLPNGERQYLITDPTGRIAHVVRESNLQHAQAKSAQASLGDAILRDR
jgi:hypothetical protein